MDAENASDKSTLKSQNFVIKKSLIPILIYKKKKMVLKKKKMVLKPKKRETQAVHRCYHQGWGKDRFKGVN